MLTRTAEDVPSLENANVNGEIGNEQALNSVVSGKSDGSCPVLR
jgi:hypothetical protein